MHARVWNGVMNCVGNVFLCNLGGATEHHCCQSTVQHAECPEYKEQEKTDVGTIMMLAAQALLVPYPWCGLSST